MQPQRTQIYLDPSQHAALIREARRLDLSLAALIRRLVDEHFHRARAGVPGAGARRRASLSLIGLGRSGEESVSADTDSHVARAVAEGLVKERSGAYRRRARRPKR